MLHTLQKRREAIRALIEKYTAIDNPIKTYQGQALLTEINKRISKAQILTNQTTEPTL